MVITLQVTGSERMYYCVIASRLLGGVAISCISIDMRLLQSLLLLRNDVTTKSQGVGGGFGLLGEQSLQQPPPAFHATSASGGHMEGSPVGLPPYLSP